MTTTDLELPHPAPARARLRAGLSDAALLLLGVPLLVIATLLDAVFLGERE